MTNSYIHHGLSKHRLYQQWYAMMHRCHDKRDARYKHYGERGITVCERWNTLENFIEDMYPTFEEGLSLDRVNNNIGYCKENCRWETQVVQQRNKQLIRSDNTSGYRGVHFDKASKKWRTNIRLNGTRKHLGYFDTAIKAATAYDTFIVTNNLEHTTNGLCQY